MTNPEYTQLKVGQLVLFTNGDYSSYGFSGLYRVLQDADLQALAKGWNEAPAAPSESGDNRHGFKSWLLAVKVLEEVDMVEVHEDYNVDYRLPPHLRGKAKVTLS